MLIPPKLQNSALGIHQDCSAPSRTWGSVPSELAEYLPFFPTFIWGFDHLMFHPSVVSNVHSTHCFIFEGDLQYFKTPGDFFFVSCLNILFLLNDI